MEFTIFHWSYRDFRAVPELLRDCSKRVEEIYLKENFISTLPDWFFVELTQLRFLSLQGNTLATLPDQIYLLQNLEFLDVSRNMLQSIPSTIGNLTRLTKLLVNENQLTTLPREMCQLKKLQVLEARKNRLTTLPVELRFCVALEDLFVDDNPLLTAIPTCLYNLPRLCFVSAQRCNLYLLPHYVNQTTFKFCCLFENRNLTHCPLELERYSQPDYESYEEKLRRIRNPPHYRRVRCSPVPYLMNLPSELQWLRNRTAVHNSPASLVELCLRVAGKSLSLRSIQAQSIPGHLFEALLSGPVALCSSIPCEEHIYVEAILMLIKRKEFARNYVLSALFCSRLCANRWHQYNCDTYDELDWTAVDSVS